jgi:hypothetical protein
MSVDKRDVDDDGFGLVAEDAVDARGGFADESEDLIERTTEIVNMLLPCGTNDVSAGDTREAAALAHLFVNDSKNNTAEMRRWLLALWLELDRRTPDINQLPVAQELCVCSNTSSRKPQHPLGISRY